MEEAESEGFYRESLAMCGSLIIDIAFGKSRVSDAYEVQGLAVAESVCF